MSICSDVSISLEEAKDRVKNILLCQQKQLIEQAMKGMTKDDLSLILNMDGDLYYYNIRSSKRKVDKDKKND
jgi:hypothetical protein